MSVLLNLDGGEHESEPDELYALADVVHVACGGHAGDERSMARVVDACVRAGTRIGAHPSYADREGFGRRPLVVAPDVLAAEIAAQCSALREAARARGAEITSAKPHGALYHAAHADEATARACVEGVRHALGYVAIVGLGGGALEVETRRAGLPYLREAFADRGVRPDGTLVPRGEPGALVDDPGAAASRTRELARIGAAETVCVHADTPNALLVVRAVREALDRLAEAFVTEPRQGGASSGAGRLASVGDHAVRFEIPNGARRRRLLDALRCVPGVRDVVLTEDVGCVVFEGDARASELVARELEASARWSADDAAASRTHEIGVVYDGEDLEAVARALGKTPQAVIAMHAGGEYRVGMLGFLPGFAYLQGLPSELWLPRRAPRPRVARNSVGVAARYTGVYPFASPGGWHLLGRAVGFDALGPEGAALAIGDAVRFVPTEGAPPQASAAPPRAAETPDRPHLEVTRALGVALLVDRGRPGHMHEGVPPGGPLVRSGLARANALAGNAPDACGVEVFGAFEVVARGGRVLVADDVARIELREGERHVVSTEGRTRARYLAVEGGIDAPPVLGSRSTLLVAGIGELVRRGDRLVPLEPATAAAASTPPPPSLTEPIALVPGPDTIDGFSVEALDGCELRISPASDRTGTRLEGPRLLDGPAGGAMARPSLPMVLGAIELTPSGLIVLGPDHPTTGGYPVVAVVRAASLDSLFARPLGATVRLTIT